MAGVATSDMVTQGNILPCDLNRPFAFISYSSKDKERVWADVYHLQKLGYNLWIDTNLKATDATWKEAALEAISNINCEIVIFYLSKSSVVSVPCLKELNRCVEPETMATHNGNRVPLLIVDVEEITDITEFRDTVFRGIKENPDYDAEEKGVKAATLTTLMDRNIPNNDKLRILTVSKRTQDSYYGEIQKYLDHVKKYSEIELYEYLVTLLDRRSNYEVVLHWLELTDMVPSVLLQAFLYGNGYGKGANPDKAKKLLAWVDMMPDDLENEGNLSWMEKGMLCRQNGDIERGVAYFLMESMSTGTPEGYFLAGKLWMKLDNYEFTKKSLELAKELGHSGADDLYGKLCGISEEQFHALVKRQKKA